MPPLAFISDDKIEKCYIQMTVILVAKIGVKKIGNIVILIPKDDPWSSLLNSLNQFTDDFVENRNQPNQDSREAFNDIHQSSSES